MSDVTNTLPEERVLVLAPTTADAAVSRTLLADAGMACQVCTDLSDLCQAYEQGAGAVLLTEEVLGASDAHCLMELLHQQPAWSDLPILLLTSEGADSPVAVEALELLGNVTLLERPVRLNMLVSALRAALKARRRQYEVRRRVEQRQAADERFRVAAEAVNGIIYECDLLTGHVERSRGLFEVVGYQPNEVPLTWEWWAEQIHPEDRERVLRVDIVGLQPSNLTAQYRVRHKDGRWLHVEDRAIVMKDGEGRPAKMIGCTVDVTDRKRAEERQRLLSEAAAVLLSTDEPDAMLKGVFAKVAPALELDVYFNFMLDDLGESLRLASCTGVPDTIARSLDRLEFGRGICGRVAVHHKPIHACRIQQSDDPMTELVKPLGLRVYACHPLQAGNQFLGTLSFASRTRDEFTTEELEFLRTICKYVASAYERLQLVRRLRETDRQKDEFLATLAHELRNPLAPIRNGLQIIKLAGGNAAAVEAPRAMMERQLEQMTRLIDDLLDLARISRGKIVLQKSRMLLADAVRNAVDTSRPLVDAQRHELILDLPAEPIYIDGDITRLSQVFANLLNNSAKYTDPGGRIRLAAERQGDEVVVRVMDNGVGIPTSMLNKVFDIFSQIDRSLEKSQGGLGIGLNLVKRLVEKHGGTISAQSGGPGKGSTFTVRLPRLVFIPESKPDKDTPRVEKVKLSPHRILVVDDNRDGAGSLVMLLKIMGNDTKAAHDGLEAIAVAEAFKPDLILMDIGMPKLNGYDACRRIREQPWGGAMLIVACTGWGQEDDKRQARDAGFDTHMTKPIDPAKLEKILAGLQAAAGK